jgi:putative redox protein
VNATTDGADRETLRRVDLERIDRDHYRARNVRGGVLDFGSGDDEQFTPVELLLIAIGGCTGIDVDYMVSKRAEPTAVTITVTGDKIRDESGNRMTNLSVDLAATFPDGPDGDQGRERLPRAVAQSRDRICTVSRTVALGTPIESRIVPPLGQP